MSFETAITISLTAVTVVLAVLAVLIALMALWGYKAIKEEAKAIAESSAKAMLSEYMDSQSIQDKLKAEVAKKVEEHADKVYDDLAMPLAFPQRNEEVGVLPPAQDFPEEPRP